MLRKLLLSGLAVISLLLAGVQTGSAAQLFYCKNPAVTNQPLILYTASPTCPPGTTVTSIDVQGPPGTALGASEFSCGLSTLTNGGPLFGNSNGYTPGVSFGSGITYTPGGATFVLQPGIYLLQLSANNVEIHASGSPGSAIFEIPVLVNGNQALLFSETGLVVNNFSLFSVTRNKLLQVTAANTTVGFNAVFANNFSASLSDCEIIFTQLQ